MTGRRIFTVAEAASYVRLGPDAIRDAIHAGDLPAKRLSKSPFAPFRIRESDVDDWFDGFPSA